LKVNVKLSKKMASIVLAQNRECYLNAIHAQEYMPEAVYVEGFVRMHDFPLVIEHGWLELNGEIIDPTPSAIESVDKRTYYAGRRLERTDTLIEMVKVRHVPLVHGKHYHGLECATYRDAYITAYRDLLGEHAHIVIGPVIEKYGE
jgi:hypothetical protein